VTVGGLTRTDASGGFEEEFANLAAELAGPANQAGLVDQAGSADQAGLVDQAGTMNKSETGA
jgi:hypothetical protein